MSAGARPFHDLFEEGAARFPDRLALAAGNSRMTYRDLNRAANRLAHVLIDRGVHADTLVGVCQQRSLEMIISLLAIWKAGAAYVPLDPAYPAARLRYILDDTQPRLLLTTRRLEEQLPRHGAQAILLDDAPAEFTRAPHRDPDVSVALGHLAYVIHTSGSTGRPKGVMIEHRGLANLSDEQVRIFKVRPEDRVLQLASLCFDASVFEIALGLRAGATLCLMPETTIRTGGALLLEALLHYRITCVTVVPSVLKLLPVERFPNLSTIIAAGEACPQELVDQWAADGRRFFNAYGPTETTVWATVDECHAGQGKPTIGTPIAHTTAHVLDAELRPAPTGTPGELYLGGVNVARGYLNAPDLTRERFIADPFAPPQLGRRLYRTGDLARTLPDGRIDFLGRVDHQIKLRGFRIDPSEIEQALCSHPAVAECLVLGWGGESGRSALVAYVVRAPGKAVGTARLKGHLGKRLPAHMVPVHYTFIEAMPLTPSGKVDRDALPRPMPSSINLDADPTVEPEGRGADGDMDLESRLAALFAAVLGIGKVDRDARFFDDLGGDSLGAVELVLRVEENFGVRLSIRVLFDADTVELLAEVIRHERRPSKRLRSAPPARIDWNREAELDPELLTARRARAAAGPDVLLTGATGFFGAFLLKELLRTQARVHCLVRSSGREDALDRIRSAMTKYGIWNQADAARIQPLAGDLTHPQLGLSEAEYQSIANAVGAIYHCAALVNFVYPYSRLKPINVEGTKNVMRLAGRGCRKTLHHLSTLAVYGSAHYFRNAMISEDELEGIDSLYMGYAESKAVAEKLVQAAGRAGLPVKIYRLDDIIGNSRTGVWNTNDFISRYIKGSVELGMVPDLDIRINAIPVDVAARIVHHVSLSPEARAGAYNIFNPAAIRQSELFGYFRRRGHRLARVTYRTWQQALLRDASKRKTNPLFPLLSLFTEAVSDDGLTLPEMYEEVRRPRFSDVNTRAALAGSDIAIPILDDRLFDRYYGNFVKAGFIVPRR